MLCSVGGAQRGLRAWLGSAAEQKFCRPWGATKLPGRPPRPEDLAIGKLPTAAQPANTPAVLDIELWVSESTDGALQPYATAWLGSCGFSAPAAQLRSNTTRLLRSAASDAVVSCCALPLLDACRLFGTRGRTTHDPFPDHASNSAALVAQPSAARVLKIIERCECELLEIDRVPLSASPRPASPDQTGRGTCTSLKDHR